MGAVPLWHAAEKWGQSLFVTDSGLENQQASRSEEGQSPFFSSMPVKARRPAKVLLLDFSIARHQLPDMPGFISQPVG
jgi:hypothetical protein